KGDSHGGREEVQGYEAAFAGAGSVPDGDAKTGDTDEEGEKGDDDHPDGHLHDPVEGSQPAGEEHEGEDPDHVRRVPLGRGGDPGDSDAIPDGAKKAAA